MHHKGRVKMTALPGGGGNSALLPISASLSRQYSSDQLYRTASSGTPSKWRRGGPGPARRAVQLAGCVLALLLCYKSLGGPHVSASEHALVVQQEQQEQQQQQQQQQVEQQQVGLLEGRKLPQQLRVERQQQQRQGQQQAQLREQQQQEQQVQVQQQLQVAELQAGHQQRQETALAALQGGQEGQQNDLSQAQPSSQQTEQQQQQQQQGQQGQEQQQQQEGQHQQQHQEQDQASQEQVAQQQPEQQQQQPQQQQRQHRQQAPALSSEQQAARLSIAQHRQHQQQAAQQYAGPLPHPAPKVALMFLVRGNMPLEAVWREFFAAAAQIEPVALPPPFAAAAAARTSQQQQQKGRVVEQQQQQQQVLEQQQQGGRRRRLATEADGDERMAAAAQQGSDAVGEAGVAGAAAAQQQGKLTEEQQQQQQQEQEQGQALGQAGPQLEGQEEQTWPPLSEFEQKQVEANQQLAAALGAGEVLQGAVAEAREATTMEAPYSMMSSVDPAGVIAQQDLFSVYVHTLPGFTYPNTALFSGHQIDRRVYVHWGQYTVAEAERRLIWFALQEPRNARFVLVSETCTPLYPPHVFYLQLLSETKSRVNACSGEGGAVADRWHSALYMPGVLGPQRWRKSAQWKSLIRQHAQLVVADRQLAPRFERECYSYFPPKIGQPPYVAAQQRQWVPRTCVSDEHYVPTLLAVHGQDQHTTCSDALTAADWVPGLWSPLIHTAADVNADLVFRLRKERWSDVDCQAAEAAASAATMFRRRGAAVTLAGQPVPGAAGGSSGSGNVRRLWQQEDQQQQQQQQQQPDQQAGQQADQRQQQAGQQQRMQGFSPLTDHCYLLARKFTPDTAPLLVELARECSSGTGISAQCLPGQQQQRL